MKRGATLIWLYFLFTGFIFGQSKAALEAQKQKAYDDLKLTRELMERTSEQRTSSMKQLQILKRDINTRASLIYTLEKEVELLNKNIQETEKKIRQLTEESKKNKGEYAKLIYYAYRNFTSYEKIMYILAGTTISQSYQRYKYLKYISDYRVNLAHEIEKLIEEMDRQKVELNSLKEEKVQAMEEISGEQEKLVAQRSRESVMINTLSRQEEELNEEIKEKERIAKELESRIRAVIEEEARGRNSDNIYAALTPEQELVGNDFKKNRGKLPWPVEKGVVTLGFGSHEIAGLRGSNVQNNGIDITSSPGTEVRAVFDGEVTKVFAILGANYTVLIRHGEFLSVYQNLVNVRVKTGDKVVTKERLGEAYTDEAEDIATMHFEMWQERSILNPEEWISK